MGTLNLNWSIKRAVVNFEDIEDEDTKTTLEKVLALCAAKKNEEAVKSLPSIDFEFDAESMDSDASEYFEETSYAFELDKKNKNYKIQAGEDNGNLILSISVVFEVKVNDGIDVDAFNEWLSDNGGWSAGNAAGMWSYSEDDGGDCEVA
jgi:hypothetical protein